MCGMIYCLELFKLICWSRLMVRWKAERWEREDSAATLEFGWTWTCECYITRRSSDRTRFFLIIYTLDLQTSYTFRKTSHYLQTLGYGVFFFIFIDFQKKPTKLSYYNRLWEELVLSPWHRESPQTCCSTVEYYLYHRIHVVWCVYVGPRGALDITKRREQNRTVSNDK